MLTRWVEISATKILTHSVQVGLGDQLLGVKEGDKSSKDSP